MIRRVHLKLACHLRYLVSVIGRGRRTRRRAGWSRGALTRNGEVWRPYIRERRLFCKWGRLWFSLTPRLCILYAMTQNAHIRTIETDNYDNSKRPAHPFRFDGTTRLIGARENGTRFGPPGREKAHRFLSDGDTIQRWFRVLGASQRIHVKPGQRNNRQPTVDRTCPWKIGNYRGLFSYSTSKLYLDPTTQRRSPLVVGVGKCLSCTSLSH